MTMTASSGAEAQASRVVYPPSTNDKKEISPDVIDHRSQKGPLLSYLWSSEEQEPLSGQSLYLGGEIGSDGRMYCIPGHAPKVLVVDLTDNDRVSLIGPEFPGKFKWLRGVRCGETIYGLPCHADSVLRIHVPTGKISLLNIPYEEFYSISSSSPEQQALQQRKQEWKYHGGTISPIDKCIYCIPQSALHVLKIDPSTDTCKIVGPELPGRYKWYGGIVGKQDGSIYGIPHNSPHVLRIQGAGAADDGASITLHGDYGQGGHKWHGAAAAPNGDIVSVPANADTVLVIRPTAAGDADPAEPPQLFELGDATCIRTGRHRSDNKYKYLGAMTGTDGKVYCFPSGSERVLQIDTEEGTVKEVGPNLFDQQMERLCQNKWQNGCVSEQEQCVYAIPLAAESVLRIDCSKDPPGITTWPLPAPFRGLAKWEGAVAAPNNGCIYTVPNNHKAVLRIEPFGLAKNNDPVGSMDKREKLNDEHLPYRSGIPTLRSSAHRVKYNIKNRKHDPRPKDRNGKETNTIWLPRELLVEDVFPCDPSLFKLLQEAIKSLLLQCDPKIVGSFQEGSDRLEDFCVPTASVWRTVNGGQCESAQKYLSDMVAGDKNFLDLYDRVVRETVLPYLKRRLVSSNAVSSEGGSTAFYYQHPPTLRLQPGPARAQVKPHNDAEYGHQNGELNFWLPLTDRELTGVDLWCETEFESNDYHPIPAKPGEIISFHGSSCRHYVNTNATPHTRVSMDFRVGVEKFFDTKWMMVGTTDDHGRKEVRL